MSGPIRSYTSWPPCWEVNVDAWFRRYMCKDPKEIKFAPLNKDTESTAEELMTIYEVRRSRLMIA